MTLYSSIGYWFWWREEYSTSRRWPFLPRWHHRLQWQWLCVLSEWWGQPDKVQMSSRNTTNCLHKHTARQSTNEFTQYYQLSQQIYLHLIFLTYKLDSGELRTVRLSSACCCQPSLAGDTALWSNCLLCHLLVDNVMYLKYLKLTWNYVESVLTGCILDVSALYQ